MRSWLSGSKVCWEREAMRRALLYVGSFLGKIAAVFHTGGLCAVVSL